MNNTNKLKNIKDKNIKDITDSDLNFLHQRLFESSNRDEKETINDLLSDTYEYLYAEDNGNKKGSSNFSPLVEKYIPNDVDKKIKYVWKSKAPYYGKCLNLEGKVFYNKSDVPSRVNYNCKCMLEEITYYVDYNGKEVEISKKLVKPDPYTKDRKEENIKYKYVWKCSEGACEKCQALDGSEYFSEEDIPMYPHPNCKCILDKIEIQEDKNGNKSEKKVETVNPKKWESKKEDKQAPDNNEKSKDEKKRKLIEKILETINKFETPIEYPYVDSEGNITAGAGYNIDGTNDPEKAFNDLPWQVDGRDATEEEKQEAWNDIQGAKEEHKDDYNVNAEKYREKTKVRLKDEDIEKLTRERIENDLDRLKKRYPNFDEIPEEIQEVLADIQYNVKGFNRNNWPELSGAIDKEDWDKAADNVSRKTNNNKRNNWAKRTAREGANRAKNN